MMLVRRVNVGIVSGSDSVGEGVVWSLTGLQVVGRDSVVDRARRLRLRFRLRRRLRIRIS